MNPWQWSYPICRVEIPKQAVHSVGCLLYWELRYRTFYVFGAVCLMLPFSFLHSMSGQCSPRLPLGFKHSLIDLLLARHLDYQPFSSLFDSGLSLEQLYTRPLANQDKVTEFEEATDLRVQEKPCQCQNMLRGFELMIAHASRARSRTRDLLLAVKSH